MGQTEVTTLMKGIGHPSLKLFKREEYIGRGGFGHVWKVLFCKGDYYLAMKQVSKKEILKNNLIANIFSERDILNILYNVHIVNLYSTFQDENYLYMIMDYLEGGDLRKHMKDKIFNLNEIKFIASCIIIGLEYLHRKGIIHRDIKPENLIFDDKGYLRISDFGIAIRNDIISTREKYNDKSGTPGYMAPERIINDKNISYTYSSDFFSLGVILYELIVLKKPFRKNIDKIGRFQYNSYEEIIHDLFNNETINLTPSLVRKFRIFENNNNNKKEINLNNNEELNNLCDLINKLLIYEQKNRLGYNSIEDIKNHPFFGERFEWKKIYHRSFKSPFNTYEFYIKNKNKEIDKYDMIKHLDKYDKINFVSDEEKIKFQNNFNNFTIIHKISKEDFNYFYLNGDNSPNILKNRNIPNTIIKYRENINKSIKNNLTILSKKNIKYLSQTKNGNNKKININFKYKITPNKLFKENNNKINIIKNINNNINNDENSLRIINSLKKIKMPIDIIDKKFTNNIINKTNLNFYKVKNLKNNIINNNINNYLPLINSERNDRKIIQKPISAMIYKKRRSNSINIYKKNNKIFFSKDTFRDPYLNLLINQKIKNKSKKEHFLTDSNNKINNSIKTSRTINEKPNLLKMNADKLINIQDYRDKIIKLKNNNIDRAIKKIFIRK